MAAATVQKMTVATLSPRFFGGAAVDASLDVICFAIA
jgi:hypothetical protein